MKINSTKSLNSKARKFLMDNLISKRGAGVLAYGFEGYINGDEYVDTTLIRKKSIWYIMNSNTTILSINGEISFFIVDEN